MSVYNQPISEAINETDPEILKEVERIMRENIFHSTLDWQDKKTFDDGARAAYAFYKDLQPDGKVDQTLQEGITKPVEPEKDQKAPGES